MNTNTVLRELSVAYGIHHSQPPTTPSAFFYACAKIVTNDLKSIERQLLTPPSFSMKQLTILSNGINLSQKLLLEGLASKEDDIYWMGQDNHAEGPIDLQIGEHKFSLKEDSFILENMGLYKMLNRFTGSNYQRGLHAFRQFAPKELEAWFQYTWQSFIRFIKENDNSWSETTKTHKTKSATYNPKTDRCTLTLSDKGKTETSSIYVSTTLSEADFTSQTKGKTRKIFSTWISNHFSSDPEYLELKNKCAYNSGERICSLISEKWNPSEFQRFLQIYDFTYYYAKVDSTGIYVYKVPNNQNWQQEILITKPKLVVPKSQLNIITKIKNIKNARVLELRNEIRYAHGQLNGTPEAKLYYGGSKTGNLSTIYQQII